MPGVGLSKLAAEVVAKCTTFSPEGKALKLDVAEVETALQRIALDVLNNHPWSFLEEKDPATAETTVNVDEYELTGTNNTARFIIDLKYNGNHIDYQERHQFFVDNDSSLVQPVKKWTIIGRNSTGNPIVKFRGKPTQSGLVISYLYTRKTDPAAAIDTIEVELAGYLVAAACSEFHPFPQKTRIYEKQAERALASALAAHTLKPNAVDQDVLDAATKRRVQEINATVVDDRFGCGGVVYNE